MSRVYELADGYVERSAALDPLAATIRGVAGHDALMTDLSPDGIDARAALDAEVLAAVRDAPVEDERDRVARDLVVERLELAGELHAAGEELRALGILGSRVQQVRMVFDLMPKEAEDDWATIATRMALVPDGLEGLQRTLQAGLDRGLPAARRQALAAADQASTWGKGYFTALVAGYAGDSPLRAELEAAARSAGEAFLGLARFLRDEYAPRATDQDAVGADRYQLRSRSFNGTELDLAETYAWGWDELHRIEAAMAEDAERIAPGAGVQGAVDLLEQDPARAIEGEDRLRGWLQDLMDRTIDELDGVHFDIPGPVRRVEAMIAPPGGAAAMYYTGPSEDFSRPGRTWYPTLGKTRFPLWGEVSIAYHEGVPGHHLQIGQMRYLAGTLSRFQRMSVVSGHAEGWALYAERLMDELGYLEVPDHHLGMLRAQAMRAARVIVDIGMHLELTIPEDDGFAPGQRWTPELGEAFMVQRSWFPPDFLASEVLRYLGLPGQAISYKVGERVWLEVREAVRRRQGPDFDLKAFHARALDLGPLGLDQLTRELGG
jgi:uncharacterized protein (DUF885 family)